MLGRLRGSFLASPRLRAQLGAAFAAVLALGGGGCSLLAGEYETETKFRVVPTTQATFAGWSELTVSEDPNSVDGAKLMFIRLEARDNNVPDLTFLKSVRAAAVVDGVSTVVAEKSPMPPGERIVPLDREYHGDIRKFFYPDPEGEGYTVRVDWSGTVDLTKPIPPEGVWIKVIIAIRVE